VYLPGITPEKYAKRAQYFPYIEPAEGFISAEGTVTYMYHAHAPHLIKSENPGARIIFTLRDPVARAWSDYRFNYAYFSRKDWSFEAVVETSLREIEACQVPDDAPADFFACPFTDPHRVMMRGVYFYPVANWLRHFNWSSMLIVTAEELRADESGTLARAVEFLSLCPFRFRQLDPIHVTGAWRVELTFRECA
jgi:hypothetical protein